MRYDAADALEGALASHLREFKDHARQAWQDCKGTTKEPERLYLVCDDETEPSTYDPWDIEVAVVQGYRLGQLEVPAAE